MVIIIKDNGYQEKRMEEVYSKILKIEFTRDNGKMTSNKVMAFKFFKINLNMKDSLKMV